MGNLQPDISELAHHLKQEKLFIESEKQHLQLLNEKVMKTIEKVYHASFIRGEQRRNYNDLVLRPHSSPPACCQRANLLTHLQFVDGCQVLGYNELLFGNLLSGLRENPKLSAQCLVVGESLTQEGMRMAASTLFSSVYANSILPEDELYILYLLHHLMKLQLAPSENPRRLLHHGSCAFSQVYRSYVDTLPQAKVFLTAALHQPIMQLLMEDELFLEIDPSKAAVRFQPEERQRRFGDEGTKEYAEALSKYRSWTISKLVKITKRFIENIRQALYCFPPTLSWLVRTLYKELMSSKQAEDKEISAICIDLVFTFFICSAVVTPEPQGIVDAPISHISRFNLIQVAQILQVLAMNKWEMPDTKLMDLYSHFDKKVMSGLLDSIIEQRGPETPPVSAAGSCPLIGLARSSCTIPETHLYALIDFLFKVFENHSEDTSFLKELGLILGPLKPHINTLQLHLQSEKQAQQQSSSSSAVFHSSFNSPLQPKNSVTGQQNSPSAGGSPKKNLLNRVKSSGRKSKILANPDLPSDVTEDINSSNPSSSSSTALNSHSVSKSSQQSPSSEAKEEDIQNAVCIEYGAVLIIPLTANLGSGECPGMMPEDRVLSSIQASKSVTCVQMNVGDEDSVVESGVEGTIEKRTRFSLSHDDGSIGNTSDNLEAISEAASNHSVDSSMDDVEQVDQPDNLSDMVSANVSGRGTPNVSGRDTPSSQVTDGDEGINRGNEPPNRTANIPVTVPKPARADIEEKFGRFEIKPILGGDETVSLVSDTWSTDVLASDSETIEAADRENQGEALHEQYLGQHIEELNRMHGSGGAEFLRGESAGETFETASEAWSTDVLASDSERLTEFDTDDAQSVARSDDTGRYEVEIELVRGDIQILRQDPVNTTEENITPRVRSFKSTEGGKYGDDDRHRTPSEESAEGSVSVEPVESSLKLNYGNVCPEKESGIKYTAITQLTEVGKSPNSVGFRPIHKPSEHLEFAPTVTVSKENHLLSRNCPEISATQSLGRLSLNLSDLPNNGIISIDQPHLFNQFTMDETIINKSDIEKYGGNPVKNNVSKRSPGGSCIDNDQNKISGGGSAEDNSIHLSTTSLASSSSSGSDGLIQLATKGQRVSLEVETITVEKTSEVKVTMTESIELATSSSSSTHMISMASTGAIPKSISFDKTAEKGDKDTLEGDSKHKRGFFKGFKLPGFKGRRKIVGRSEDYSMGRSLGPLDAGIRRSLSEDSRRPILEESTDDILAKYRKKPETTLEADNSSAPTLDNLGILSEDPSADDERLFIDVANLESSYAFKDAKKKLRLVLSSANLCMSSNFLDFTTDDIAQEKDLLIWLKTQLAEAQNLHDRSLVAQLHEALRCVQLFDQQGRDSLVHSIGEDYQSRSPYIAYLVRSRQGLLNSIAHLEMLLSRLNADIYVFMTSMVSECVRMFLERRDIHLGTFTRDFTILTVPDEKVELVESFLLKLYGELERDPMWISSTPEQLNLAQMSLERAIMSHIYIHALYPNGDGDVSRDKVLYEHMKKLSAIITPSHKDLRVPKLYQYECPWPSAQAELTCLGAYKTSQDKVRCVVRTSQTIMNLLSMAHETSVPSADDFIPVLVYVLIKANPPCLLSTVQYVNLFYEQRLTGEDQYWWTHFCSSIEFIKTMDYAH